ncbi:MAG: histidinol-phosphate transaminase [Acidimicrobiia bacterium]|nr:histidinol-phosphate transaminase [Acidimicrobiia bacterium]
MTDERPQIRPRLLEIDRYRPGTPAEVIAAQYRLDEVIKLASNENPDGPFPGVVEAVAEAVERSNRYPDNSAARLKEELAKRHGILPENIFPGAGSSAVLQCIALAMGGAGTSAVYPWPSFVLYEILSKIAGTEGVRVQLDNDHRVDLDVMVGAMRHDTNLVYVCNPNNPTGTYRSRDDILALVDAVAPSVLVVVDEAYAEYAIAPDFGSLANVAVHRPNVLVLRTFSKIYGLAALRIGYAIGHPETLADVSRAQTPFTVTTAAQAGALASLPHDLAGRRETNRTGVDSIERSLSRLGVTFAPSQANFVWFDSGIEGEEMYRLLARRGVVVRNYGIGSWIRVTIGSAAENQAFIVALEGVLGS